MNEACAGCGGTGRVWPEGHQPATATRVRCPACGGRGSRRPRSVEEELQARLDAHQRNDPPPDDSGPARGIVLSVALGLLLWAAVIALALQLFGCETGRQFTRLDVSHYASEDETFVSSTSVAVGRYLTISEDELEAEVYTGTWYDLDGAEPYALFGAGLTWYAPREASVSLTGEGFVPEGGGPLEYYGSLSVEVPWP